MDSVENFFTRIKEIFYKIIINEKIANAYLLGGGTVKTTASFAAFFARVLNCANRAKDPCSCKHCQMIAHQTHPDFLELNLDNINIKINQVREIKELVQYGPAIAQYKVIIVHYASKLTPEAANSFLKILEEPPLNVVFFLLADNYQSLPNTIISRCQLFIFPQESRLAFYQQFTAQKIDLFAFTQKVMLAQCEIAEIFNFIEKNLMPHKDQIADIMEMIVFCLVQKLQEKKLSLAMKKQLRLLVAFVLENTRYLSKNTLNTRLQLEALYLKLYALMRVK